MDEPPREKPSIRAAFLSLPFTANSIFAWLLVACFWMPFGVGCDKKTVHSPSVILGDLPDEPMEFAFMVYLFWPYVFGLLLGLLLIFFAWRRPKDLTPWLLPAPFGLLVTLVVMGVIACVFNSESPKEKVVLVAFIVLPQTAVLVWVTRAWRRGDRLLAATRVLCGLSLLMPLTYYSHAVITLLSRFLYGFYVSVAVSIGLTVSVWFLFTHGEQTFCDTRAPLRKVQFRIRTLMVWTLIIAVASAVLQNVSQ